MPEPAEDRLTDLERAATYHRERLQLYRAKSYGSRPTTSSRMRELERSARDAEERLEHWRATHRPPPLD